MRSSVRMPSISNMFKYIHIYLYIYISIPDAEVAEPTENADDFVSWFEIMAI